MTLIIIYIVVCLLIILYIAVFAFTLRSQSSRQDKLTLHIGKKLKELPLDDLNSAKWTQFQADMVVSGRNINKLHCYDEALQTFARNEEWAAVYFPTMEESYLQLARHYQHVYGQERVYFVHHVSQYAKYFTNRRLFEILLSFMNRRNIFEREGVLQALYLFGDISLIKEGLHKISSINKFHHSKLIADGLLKVNPVNDELTEALWDDFLEYPGSIQVGIIKYIQGTSGAYRDKFYKYLENDNGDLDIRLNMIRYFRKYPYEPIYPYLLAMLEGKEESQVEYRIVAAHTLVAFPGKRTVQALQKALKDCDWYVRVNASQSLLALNVSMEELEEVFGGDDRFAKEILAYHLTVKEGQLHE